MKIVFVKRYITLHDQHHASGGRHAFACLARALAAAAKTDDNDAAAANEVTLLFAAAPSQVLAAAAAGGWLQDLKPLQCGSGAAPPPPPAPPLQLQLATWARGGVTHCAAPRPRDLPRALAALLLSPPPSAAAPAVVIIDADESQSAAGGEQAAELAATTAAAGARPVFFVQNAHHLPFGPNGCAPRATALLDAWARADGVLTVSRWLLGYLNAHAPPPAAPAARFAASLAAAGAFGAPRWPDRGAAACDELWPAAEAAETAATPAVRPTVIMLKRTPEKGAALFDAVAAQMPECDFVAVDCSGNGGGFGDAAALQPSSTPPLSPSLPPNVKLVPPTADLDMLLGSAHASVAPSLVDEGFGMAVVDALLRGVPCVVAAGAGALEEAGLGAAAAAPVNLARLPLACGACGACVEASGREQIGSGCDACGAPPGALTPSWERRVLPPQDLPAAEWAAALRALFGRRRDYQAASRAARAAALAFVEPTKCAAERTALLQWLASLGSVECS